LRALLHEDDLPVVEAQGKHVAVVGEVDEALTRALLLHASQVGEQVEAVDADLVGGLADRVTGLQLFDDVRLARGCEEGRQPVVMLYDLVRDDAGGNPAGPADHLRNSESALPVRVLLAAERRHPSVWPRVHVRPVVRRVDDDRVVRNTELVERV
jgi:hypothetical protein